MFFWFLFSSSCGAGVERKVKQCKRPAIDPCHAVVLNNLDAQIKMMHATESHYRKPFLSFNCCSLYHYRPIFAEICTLYSLATLGFNIEPVFLLLNNLAVCGA